MFERNETQTLKMRNQEAEYLPCRKIEMKVGYVSSANAFRPKNVFFFLSFIIRLQRYSKGGVFLSRTERVCVLVTKDWMKRNTEKNSGKCFEIQIKGTDKRVGGVERK